MTALHTQDIPETTASGEYPSYYGLGFSKIGPRNHNGPSAELRTADGFGHGGATGTYLWIEPQLELVFVFLTNRWATNDDTFRRALNATIAARSLER
jgi:CubicO group peptidase (beta-lactamase class C family)